MIDSQQFDELIRTQLSQAINNNIAGLVQDAEWLSTVESMVVDYAKQRVVAKFNNSDSMEEILSSVTDAVKNLFESGKIDQIKNLVDSDKLTSIINKELSANIEQHVQELFVDNTFLINIKKQLLSTLQSELKKRAGELNLNEEVKGLVADLFSSSFNGIKDTASDVELSVSTGSVVAKNSLLANDIQATDSVKTQNLIVNGGIAGAGVKNLELAITEAVYAQVAEQSANTIADIVLDKAKAGIEFNSVRIDGLPLIDDGKLNRTIKDTSITSVGTLASLDVAGETTLHNNTAVVVNKRVGINTVEPSMSLDVWDEEVQVSIGKKKERTGFIGSNRLQNLEIGVNGRGNITITDDNVVVVKNLQVDKNRISWGNEVPGYSGSKGDIVYNTNLSADKPVFAWMCVGGFNWIALSASAS